MRKLVLFMLLVMVCLVVVPLPGAQAADSATIKKCKVKAGKSKKGEPLRGVTGFIPRDSISFSGILQDLTVNDLEDAAIGGHIFVTVNSADMPQPPYIAVFDVLEGSVKKGKYSSPRIKVGKTDPKESLKIDGNKRTLKFSAKNVDLTGLNCPMSITIEIGNYVAQVQLGEDIVNGKKPVPIQFMMGVKNILRVDKPKVKFGKKDSSDSLSVKGAFTVVNLQAFQNGLAAGDPIVVILGSANITVSGKMAKFDPVKCKFTIKIKGLNITEYGEVDFGVNFFGVTVMSLDKIDLGPKRAYNLEELRRYDVPNKAWDYQSAYSLKGPDGSEKGVEPAYLYTGSGLTNINGHACYRSSYDVPGEWEDLYWYTGAAGGTYVAAWDGGNDVCYFEFDTELQVAPPLLRLGQSFKADPTTFTGSLDVYVDDADVTITNLNGTVKSTCKLVRHEEVTVPNGTYTAAKVEQTYVINGTMDVEIYDYVWGEHIYTTGKVSIKIKDTWWGAPGVGIVKARNTMSMKLSAKGAGSLSAKVTNSDVLTSHN